MRRIAHVVGLAVLGTLLVAAPVSAGKPQIERVNVDDTFVDEFLSEACGTEVTFHATGHITFRLFADAAGNPIRELNNYALTAVYSSENGAVRAKDVGVDRITYLPDGSLLQFIIGNVQSFSIPGQGRVYQDVGRTMVVITFDADGVPSFEATPLGGQHDPDQVGALCSVLGD
jgi:hypothetical protein